MSLSKSVVVSAVCAILFVTWLNNVLPPAFEQNDSVTKFTGYTREWRGRKTLARPTAERNNNSNTVVIIGYRRFGVHKYPFHCSCDGETYLVTNNSAYLQTAPIVVFTLGAQRNMSLNDWRRYHKERKESQIWVLGSRESPQTCTSVLPPKDMLNVYNWSFTYHSKADFPVPYGGYKMFKREKFGLANWFAQKKNLISWTSSHCPLPDSRYKRRDFVLSLKEHLNITMYGTCGDGRLDRDVMETMKSYKFALALENSCCSEYITEKFWDALVLYNQVPVVYGATREEYERIGPPDSFIFIQDFSSLEELASYLKKVGNNETEYNKYHSWRKNWYAYKQNDREDVRVYGCHSICRMARKLEEVEAGKRFHFNEKSVVYNGGCRECQKEINIVTGNS